MNYLKSGGFFALFYLFIYWILSLFPGIFIHDSNFLSIFIYVGILLFTLLYLRICKEDMKKRLHLRKLHIGSWFLIPVLTIAVQPFISLISTVAGLFFHDLTTTSIAQSVSSNPLMSFVALAIMPGIVEETIFRGVLYTGMRKARPVKGILLSALFFGLAHMNFQQFSYAFVIGILFGLLLEVTDSLFAPMTMHICFNGISVISMILLTKFGDMTQVLSASADKTSVSDLLILIPFALLSLVATVFLFIVIAHLNGRLGYVKTWFQKEIRHQLPRERATNVCYWIAVVIAFLFCILMEVIS